MSETQEAVETKKEATVFEKTKVILKTTMGDISLELSKETPITTSNFIKHIKEGFYNDTIFHRVIDNFMIQGGGFTEDMKQKDSIVNFVQNEAALCKPNKKGTIAMARTYLPHSATSQFFINVKDNDFLNFKEATMQGYGYCTFGEVTEGLDIVEKISKVKTGPKNGHEDVPEETIKILSVEILEKDLKEKAKP